MIMMETGFIARSCRAAFISASVFWRSKWDGHDGNDTIERWPRRPAQAACCFAAGIAAPARWIIILGRFADAKIGSSCATSELTELERLIELPDPDLYAAFSGRHAARAGICDRRLFVRIKAFLDVDHDA